MDRYAAEIPARGDRLNALVSVALLSPAATITTLFPLRVEVETADEAAYAAALFPAEAALVQDVSDKRLREFRAGRLCARTALRRLGGPVEPILRSGGRAPRWPAGFTGSISHCAGLCCAVVARQEQFAALGIDVEPMQELSPQLANRICHPEERETFSAPHVTSGAFAALVFSAKEAFYKCASTLGSGFLDFHDVRLEFGEVRADGGAFRGRTVTGSLILDGRWKWGADHIYAAAWRTTETRPTCASCQ